MFNEDCILKPIKEYDYKYLISNYGDVFSINLKRVLNTAYDTMGYAYVRLYLNGNSKNESIHRLVAKYFIKNEENKYAVNHIDGNKKNNHVDNLEWVTQSENEIHASQELLKLNNFNKKLSNNKSGHIGICKKKSGKKEVWYTYCNFNKKRYFIGNFDSIEEAVLARQEYMENNNIKKIKKKEITND